MRIASGISCAGGAGAGAGAAQPLKTKPTASTIINGIKKKPFYHYLLINKGFLCWNLINHLIYHPFPTLGFRRQDATCAIILGTNMHFVNLANGIVV